MAHAIHRSTAAVEDCCKQKLINFDDYSDMAITRATTLLKHRMVDALPLKTSICVAM
jgi:hypothetical protein